MMPEGYTNSLLSLLDGFTLDNSGDIAKEVASNFRRRRVEKNITRRQISEDSGVPLSTVARFERQGLISFDSLIRLAMALGFTAEVRSLFGAAKYDTMQELETIRRKRSDKRAYPRRKEDQDEKSR